MNFPNFSGLAYSTSIQTNKFLESELFFPSKNFTLEKKYIIQYKAYILKNKRFSYIILPAKDGFPTVQ